MTRRAFMEHHWMYEFVAPYGEYVCVYCGESADSRDHAPSLASLHRIMDTVPSSEWPRCHLYPSCRECNMLLNDCADHTMVNRRGVAHKRLRKRHKRLLEMPNWEPEELSDLSPRLRESVEASLRQRERLRERLRFPMYAVLSRRTA